MKLAIYVNYPGHCEEAFRFYQDHPGATFMKLESTPFANRFAMLRDRFGTSWLILHQP